MGGGEQGFRVELGSRRRIVFCLDSPVFCCNTCLWKRPVDIEALLYDTWVFKATWGQLDIGRSPAAMMPQITSLDVQCEKTGMTVHVEFDRPYNGIIFSKGHYSTASCRYVNPRSGRNSYEFVIPMSGCGTVANDNIDGTGQFGFDNTIIFQNDELFQEIWDVARKISCGWISSIEKFVTFRPFTVDMLEVKEVFFTGDNVDCWMDLQRGEGPFAPPVNGIVKIGETLTIVIYTRDDDGSFDLLVKDCYAYDSPEFENTKTRRIQLTDKSGCPVKEKLLRSFYRTRRTKNTGASIIAYGFINAFKFPDKMDVYIACNVEICKNSCASSCQPEVTDETNPGGRTEFPPTITTRRTPPPPTRPPILPTRPPTRLTRPPTQRTRPPTRGTRPPTRRTRPPTRGTRPPTRRTRPPTRGTRPPTRRTRPPTRGTRPPTRRTRPPTRGTRPTRPPIRSTRPTVQPPPPFRTTPAPATKGSHKANAFHTFLGEFGRYRTHVGRKRRDVELSLNSHRENKDNATLSMYRSFTVLAPDDLSDLESDYVKALRLLNQKNSDSYCMSVTSFFTGLSVLLGLLTISFIVVLMMCLRIRNNTKTMKSISSGNCHHS
ncbi:uncharacterized protein LOC106463446 [Limulus polyphemus]|uniref:Uncharacterized protein LOC106463446 n=1 Tax=Limulus polyphemus TaxID=6850 RepID=A0ABM1BBZ3_LIMPO|nr:uncharacterized protein LOC106463446 [Limulus polyphemus]